MTVVARQDVVRDVCLPTVAMMDSGLGRLDRNTVAFNDVAIGTPAAN